MNEAVIVSAVRTAVGRAKKGTLRDTRPDDMAAAVIKEAVGRVEGLDPAQVEDVILGCAMPEGEQGLNMARIAIMRAGLPQEICGVTINRFCASGLQSIAMANERVAAGGADVVVAGGAESMSMVPMTGHKFAPNPWLAENYPQIYLNMGLTAENVAREYGISRDEADAFALRSHQCATAALRAGKFDQEVVPLEVDLVEVDEQGQRLEQRTVFTRDEGPRADTSPDALAKLKPVFHAKGSVTAGNSSQMSDGAAAVVVMSRERAEAIGAKPLARLLSFAVGGVAPEVMGIGPVVAVPKALQRAGLTLDQIDLIELNEAFATQALAVIKQLDMDPDKVNVNGGAIALGHPLGCTGAKLTVQILNELRRRNGRYGLVTMCIGGGMGAAGVFELLD